MKNFVRAMGELRHAMEVDFMIKPEAGIQEIVLEPTTFHFLEAMFAAEGLKHGVSIQRNISSEVDFFNFFGIKIKKGHRKY